LTDRVVSSGVVCLGHGDVSLFGWTSILAL